MPDLIDDIEVLVANETKRLQCLDRDYLDKVSTALTAAASDDELKKAAAVFATMVTELKVGATGFERSFGMLQDAAAVLARRAGVSLPDRSRAVGGRAGHTVGQAIGFEPKDDDDQVSDKLVRYLRDKVLNAPIRMTPLHQHGQLLEIAGLVGALESDVVVTTPASSGGGAVTTTGPEPPSLGKLIELFVDPASRGKPRLLEILTRAKIQTPEQLVDYARKPPPGRPLGAHVIEKLQKDTGVEADELPPAEEIKDLVEAARIVAAANERWRRK